MAGIPKRLRIAVVGGPASGKSYLLYDLIHAFGLLGYKPEELPLDYAHSSFGTYFYDTFNSVTGGMRGTERYACRPNNHYGAWLSRGALGRRLEVDFLNIPGEAFDMNKAKDDRMDKFFALRKLIERRKKGLFFLSTWRNQAGLEKKLIVYKDLDFNNIVSIKAGSQSRFGNYLSWENLCSDLQEGKYKEVECKPVDGRYLFRHLTELQTDSVLLTIEHCWQDIASTPSMSLENYKADQVLFYFYPLVYCQQATDLIICDNLMQDRNAGTLAERVAYFMRSGGNRRPNAYLAFRGADRILDNCPSAKNVQLAGTSVANTRNPLYEGMMQDVLQQMSDDEAAQVLPSGWKDHVNHSLGDGVGCAFWHLLNATASDKPFSLRSLFRKRVRLSEQSQSLGFKLPPHVYFTATPVDADCRIYQNDPANPTRFCCEEGGRIRSFTTEVNSGRIQHLCLGAYQLLTDILLQNGIRTEGLEHRGEHLRYMQSMI